MKKEIDYKILKKELKEITQVFYPYFFSFYLLSLVVSFFSNTLRNFFYWPAFHGFAIFFTVLFFLFLKLNLKKDLEKIRYFIKKEWVRILIIIVVLIFAVFKGIEVLDFLILIYALISLLFILNSRLSAILAMICLITCPVLLVFKKDIIAETIAVYAFYFLVITVLIQIRELKGGK
jgi:hypothetical protein